MVDVRVADADDAREDAFDVRHEVFVDEQGVDEALEYDEYDEPESDAVHFVAYSDDTDACDAPDASDADPIGAARLRTADASDIGKIERVAVREPWRKTGVGRALMLAIEARADEQGLTALTLHSQTHAAGFYRELDYESIGDEFTEAGIPHVKMRKRLDGDEH
ncbi:GNAT family N-acetyltransferase [Natrialba asiatica]|uniref:N-acetyltransferase GCN5 n=1 Tax=Natrialba asiatica (strain ATCC 700177 / DSM 12278 / JCM 9576 / FERM P-10747 / NBRC 102637 / 172P1) TaxID=29540 RepID=M0AKT3_NATA1|nr:GNAT family N-acetyltransferase [Natrialba asiatica]ELY99340.1 N-acetyltransferase GCN5 [Natrialba asiatica DSM 12278]